MIDVKQFRDLVIVPTLWEIEQHSDAAVELLLGTALQESRLTYVHQLGSGPAKGVFQMEPRTHDDIWENYLAHKPYLADLVRSLSFSQQAVEMIGNMFYAAAMCRVHYLRVYDPLPPTGDIEAMAAYWKEHYNTYLGAGTEEEYEENWREGTFML